MFKPLNLLKSQTFSQVALALILITALQIFSKGSPINATFSNSLIDSPQGVKSIISEKNK